MFCLPTSLLFNAILICTGTPGIVPRVYPYPGYCAEVLTEVTEVPGTGKKPLQNSQKFRVSWQGRTELTEVPGRYKTVVPVPRVLSNGAYRTYRTSGYGYEGRTELAEDPGAGINALTEPTEVLCTVFPG